MATQPLAEHVVSGPQRNSSIELKDDGQRGSRLVLWGFVLLLLGAAIGVLGKKLLHQDVVTVAGILMSLVGMFLTVFPYLVPARSKKPGSVRRSQPEDLTATQPSKHLAASNMDYIPSITERTTDLLKNSVATKNGLKEDGRHLESREER